jgi:hypothetical protein
MPNLGYDIFINTIAGCLGGIVAFLLSWLAGFLWARSERGKLQRFFKVSAEQRLVVYLSSIQISLLEREDQYGKKHRASCTTGPDGQRRTYTGKTVVFGELEMASIFRDIFSSPFPYVGERPSFLRKILMADMVVQIEPSPGKYDEIDQSASIITLGSPGYNKVSEFVEQKLSSEARFIEENSAIKIGNAQPEDRLNFSFIEKVVDTQRSVFYAAGMTETGTKGAAYFLATRWSELRRNENERGFVVLLDVDKTNYKNAKIVSTMPK